MGDDMYAMRMRRAYALSALSGTRPVSPMQHCPITTCGQLAFHYDPQRDCWICDRCGHTDRPPRR